MININLLGKKKAQAIPGLDKIFEKIGIKGIDPEFARQAGMKIAALAIGLYVGFFVPNYLYELERDELRARLDGMNEQIKTLQKQYDAKKDIRKQMEELTKQETEAKRRLDIIMKIARDREVAFRTFENFTNLLPQKVWLNRVEFNNLSLTLEGSAWEYPSVNEFIKSLSESAYFDAVTLRTVAADASSALNLPGVSASVQKQKNFNVEMLLKGQG